MRLVAWRTNNVVIGLDFSVPPGPPGRGEGQVGDCVQLSMANNLINHTMNTASINSPLKSMGFCGTSTG